MLNSSFLTGYLFAVGGYDGASRQCLSSVECYNTLRDVWTPVADMSCRRSGAGRILDISHSLNCPVGTVVLVGY